MAHKWWHSAPTVSSKNSPGYPGPKIDTSKSAVQKITDDFLMDTGFKKPDEDYYARVDDRTARSQQAMAEIQASNQKRDSESRNSILTTTKEEEEEEKKEEEEEKGDDTTKVLVGNLDLENVDDTDASKDATDAANEAYTDVKDQSTDTFGTGDGVTDVVQQDSSFIDADTKTAEELAADNATLAEYGISVDDLSRLGYSSTEQFLSETERLNAIAKEAARVKAAEEAAKLSADAALTFNGKVYGTLDEMIEAIRADTIATENAAAAGGASSILGKAGSNTTTVNSGDALDEVTVAEQNLNTSSAKGGSMEAAAAQPMSTGASEDDAIDMYTEGRRSTILTTPGGLLNADEEDEDGTFRKRRGLIS